MSEWLKLTLLILLGGAGVTLAAWWAAYFMTEDRRLARAFRQGLGLRPDAALISHGAGRGVALSLASRRFVTAWDAGGWRLSYPLDELLGVELELDGEVAARALRGEPRRLLERQSGAECEVRLRFLFDDARHPDFELVLWPTQAARGGPARPREAIAEGKRWIARVEAVLRKTGAALALARPAPPPIARPTRAAAPELFDDDEDADEDEADVEADELAD